MWTRLGLATFTVGALYLTACGSGLQLDTDVGTGTENNPDGDTTDLGTDDPGTDDPGTEDPGTEDPGTEDPGTEDPGTEACIPECSGQVCGADGCGGSCGFCSGGDVCSDNGDECVSTAVECRPVTLQGELTAAYTNGYYIEGTVPESELDLYFFSSSTGTFTLDSGPNANFSSCEQCLLYFEDGVTYYQSAGQITVVDTPDDGDVALTLTGVELVESTFSDAEFPVSTPVPGGECVSLAPSLSFATPTPPTCATVAPTSAFEPLDDAPNKYASLADNAAFTGSVGAIYQLEFFTDATGTFNFDSAVNADYETCDQCLRLFVVEVDPADADELVVSQEFHVAAGTVTVSGSPLGGAIYATIANAVLVEVEVTTQADYSTYPIAGGECIEAPPSFDVVVPAR